MRKYEEIRRILTDELGFRDLASYRRWIEEERPRSRPTKERIERLSPDHVDCRDFWSACDELFGVDPVCNVAVGPGILGLEDGFEARVEANRANLRLAKTFGITSFLEEHAEARLRTFEIGPGFGGLKDWIETNTRHRYTAFDVVARVHGVREATVDGCLPESFLAESRGDFAYVVSSNVFQHLSARQRSRWYSDVHALLRAGGLFLFNLSVDVGNQPACARDADGVAWADHYGQYTLIPKPADLFRELRTRFDLLYTTQRWDGVLNLVCRKRA
jgi:hypothetical protein